MRARLLLHWGLMKERCAWTDCYGWACAGTENMQVIEAWNSSARVCAGLSEWGEQNSPCFPLKVPTAILLSKVEHLKRLLGNISFGDIF